MRVGIGHKVQIVAVSFYVNVRDIAHPQLIRLSQNDTLNQVVVLMESMVGVRCVPRTRTRQRQSVPVHYLKERISTGHPIRHVSILDHAPHLVSPDTCIFFSYRTSHLYDCTFMRQVVRIAVALLVVGLSCSAKQLASSFY